MAFKGIKTTRHPGALVPQRRQDTGAPEPTPQELWYDEEFEPILDPSTLSHTASPDALHLHADQPSAELHFDAALHPKVLAQIEALCRFLKWDTQEQQCLEQLSYTNTPACQQLVQDLYEQYVQPQIALKSDPLEQMLHQDTQGCYIGYELPEAKTIIQLDIEPTALLYYFNGSRFIWHPLNQTPFDTPFLTSQPGELLCN